MTLRRFVRGAIFLVGVLLMVAGLRVIVILQEAMLAGLWNVAVGAVLVGAVVLERQRYRSEAAERGREAPGPGGGETADSTIETRFRPTAEVFVDPTTGHHMRVMVDSRTGERRYVAEG